MSSRNVLCLCAVATLGACTASEAPRVSLPVVVDGSAMQPVQTALGYTVELTEARVAIADLVFTFAGEVHASIWQRARDWLVPTAYAHPGHFQGGDVTGELRGRFIVDWTGRSGTELGVATLLAGEYKAANFTFAVAGAGEVPAGDPLVGHTALLRGQARKDGRVTQFTFLIDSPDGRQLVGAPFVANVDETTSATIGLRLQPHDPLEGDSLFEDLDFATIDSDGDGAITVAAAADNTEIIAAYNTMRRTLQTHDHFDAQLTAR